MDESEKAKWMEEVNAKLKAKRAKDLVRQREKEYNDVAYSLIRNGKKRARAKGLSFTIGPADVVVPERCPILAIPLKKHRGIFGKDSPSLDRVDSTLGYVPGNVRVISWWANMLKNDLSLEQIENLYKYVKGEL